MKLWCLLLVSLFLKVTASAAPLAGAVVPAPEQPAVLQKAGVKNVRCLFRDHNGVMWIGTDQGLYRYDGTNIDFIRHQPHNPSAIPQNEINSITEDKQNRIWIGTNQGVARMDGSIFRWEIYNRKHLNLANDFDNKVYCDSGGDILLGNSKGLYKLDKGRDLFRKVWDQPVKDQAFEYVTCVADWKRDSLVAGTFTGLVIISKKNWGYRRVPLAKGRVTVDKLWVDGEKRVWIGTWGFGCLRSDSACSRFTSIKWEKTSGAGLPNVVTGMLATRFAGEPKLWVSTLQGIYRIDNAFTGKQPSVLKMIGGIQAAALIADDNDYIWIGGRWCGRFFAGKHFFSTFYRVQGVPQDLRQFHSGGKNLLVIPSWYARSGVTVLNQADFKPVYMQPEQHNIDDAAICDIAADRFGRFWAGSLNGIKLYNQQWKAVPLTQLSKNGNPILPGLRVNVIDIIRDTVWVGEYHTGIELFDLNFHRLKTFRQNDGCGLRDNLLNHFFCDSKGRIWVCGNSSLYLYKPASGKFISYNLDEEKGLFSVNDIAELSGERLAVASSTGLFIFDVRSGHAEKISAPLLSDDNIQSVAVDEQQNLLYITRDNLVLYRPAARHFTVFGEDDGLPAGSELGWLRSFDGRRFFLADRDKLITFEAPSALARNPMQVYLHEIQANDSSVTVPTPGSALRLDHRQRRLTFEFGAVNYIKPEQNQYAYRLSGVDDRWVYTLHNTASYDNLAPGSYVFRLKAQNAAGVWGIAQPLQIVINPPFWATWWFRLLSIIIVSALLFTGIRYVLQRNLRERILRLEKEQAVERERNRIAGDMHDDLGSGLTKIAILSELTRAHIGNKATAQVQLEKISSVSRELVDSLQNIVWLLNPRNDSLESLALYIRRYIDNFFESSGILPVFDFPDEISYLRLSEEQRRNIFLVAKEICNNILKHSEASTVMVKMRVIAGQLILTITDNGKGFDSSDVSGLSNGLRNIQARMEQISGSFKIETSLRQGTAITIATS